VTVDSVEIADRLDAFAAVLAKGGGEVDTAGRDHHAKMRVIQSHSILVMRVTHSRGTTRSGVTDLRWRPRRFPKAQQDHSPR